MARFGVSVAAGVLAAITFLALSAPGFAATGEMAEDRPLPSTPIGVGAVTTMPYGWADFCRRYDGECKLVHERRADIHLSAGLWAKLKEVSRSTNASVQPVSDMDHWGIIDQWDYPTDGRGDCEDYALMKRKLLIEDGIPRRDLLMTVVRDLNDEGHAVLLVKTDAGDYVLDNMTDAVKPWRATGYRFVKRQSQEDPNVWVKLRGSDVPVVSATP